MPILRGFTGEIRTMPPDIYVNEMPVPQADSFTMPDFVLGFVGEFDRGPVNEYVYCSETPTKRMTEIVRYNEIFFSFHEKNRFYFSYLCFSWVCFANHCVKALISMKNIC